MELPRVIKYAWERLEYLNAKRQSLSAVAVFLDSRLRGDDDVSAGHHPASFDIVGAVSLAFIAYFW